MTTRNQTQTQASEERMRAVMESALDCVITMDHQGRVLEFNPAAERTFGYKRDEAIGQLLTNLIIPPALRERHKRELSPDLSSGEGPGLGQRVEITGMRRDNSELPLELAITQIKSQGSPMFTGFIRDITARKQAEGRLREQARLLELAQDAIMVLDMEDRVEFWNHGAEKLYGWTAPEVQGKEASYFLYEDETVAATSARVTVLENGKWTGECSHICKDGTVVVVCSRWTLVRDELAAPKSILIINTDITEQKKIEGQFLRTQRLENIGTLARGVAHDLNNIIAPILLCAPLLREETTPADREHLVDLIVSSAQRGADIVKQVLTFAGGGEGKRMLVQPTHFIDDLASLAAGTFPKNIAVRTRYDENIWAIESDPIQLHQVLLNLCVNARDAMPNGGTLTIGAENLMVDEGYAAMMPEAKAGPHVILEVSDTGLGISREIMDKIFDPFFTTKEGGTGTGLGLSTALGIIKNHGGFISVKSAIGAGTSFKVFLPARENTDAVAVSAEFTSSAEGHGETILVVDDELAIRRVTEVMLTRHNYRVLVAADGPEALALFALNMAEVKAVLADIAMPHMDGLMLARALKKMKPEICIVASAGHAEDPRIRDLRGIGVETCLNKPYNIGQLLTALEQVLSVERNRL